MLKEAIATGTTVEEAKENAFKKLGAVAEEVDFEILELPEKKIFGLFGGKLAKVRVYVENKINTTSNSDASNKKVQNSTDVKARSTESKNKIKSNRQSDVKKSSMSQDHDLVEAKKIPRLTDEQKSQIETNAIEYIKSMIKYLVNDFDEVKFSSQVTSRGITIKMESKEAKSLIGFRGETLLSLQTLVNLYVRKGLQENQYLKVCLDVCDYKRKHEKAIVALAHSKAAFSRKNHKKISLRPMGTYDRKIVHLEIKKEKGIISWSEGTGNKRHVVIAPATSRNSLKATPYSKVTKPDDSESIQNKKTELDDCIKTDEGLSSPLYGKIK